MFTKTCVRITLILILYVGSIGGVSAQAESPTLSPGMQWEYAVTMSLADLIGQVEGGFEEMVIEGTVILSVDSLQTVQVAGSTYDAWVIALDGIFDVEFTYDVPNAGLLTMSAPASSEGLLYLDNESFEFVKSSIMITSRFSRFSVTFDMVVEIETTLDVQTDSWLFPFDTGSVGVTTGQASSYAHYVAKVNGDVVGENETSASYSSVSTYDCLGLRTVSVDAGDFQAYELDVSSAGIYLFGYPQGHRREYYSNEVNSSVEVMVYDDDDRLIGQWSLRSYGEYADRPSEWSWWPALLLLIILLTVLIVFILMKRSRQEPADEDTYSARRICRRCGVYIPEGEKNCPSCGRAIW